MLVAITKGSRAGRTLLNQSSNPPLVAESTVCGKNIKKMLYKINTIVIIKSNTSPSFNYFVIFAGMFLNICSIKVGGNFGKKIWTASRYIQPKTAKRLIS